MTSLAANEKLFLISNLKSFSLVPIFLVSIFFIRESFKIKISSNFIFVAAAYELNFILILIICFLFLLLAIIRVIKLIKLEDGPLVKRL